MTKIAVILILVGLTVMASASILRRPHFDQGLLNDDVERTQLSEKGIKKTVLNSIYLLSFSLVYIQLVCKTKMWK